MQTSEMHTAPLHNLLWAKQIIMWSISPQPINHLSRGNLWPKDLWGGGPRKLKKLCRGVLRLGLTLWATRRWHCHDWVCDWQYKPLCGQHHPHQNSEQSLISPGSPVSWKTSSIRKKEPSGKETANYWGQYKNNWNWRLETTRGGTG